MKKVLLGNLQEQPMFEEAEGGFVLIEVEKFSEEDSFMKYNPRTTEESTTKGFIEQAIRNNVKNFYCSRYSPSFTDDKRGICFVPGRIPAVGKDYYWWLGVAGNYKPEKNSRLGTKLEYFAFLAELIRRLVAQGKSVSWSWNAVCNDSRELGHYMNSDYAKLEFEVSGSRPVCGFYDLANTSKIITTDECWIAGGSYKELSFISPLAYTSFSLNNCSPWETSTGWIVHS